MLALLLVRVRMCWRDMVRRRVSAAMPNDSTRSSLSKKLNSSDCIVPHMHTMSETENCDVHGQQQSVHLEEQRLHDAIVHDGGCQFTQEAAFLTKLLGSASATQCD